MVTSAKTTSFVQRLQTPKTTFIYSMERVLFIIILLDVDTDLNILESVICYYTKKHVELSSSSEFGARASEFRVRIW